MMNSKQQDVFLQMQTMGMPNQMAPYEPLNPMDQFSMQKINAPKMIPKIYPSYHQEDFQKPIVTGYNEGHHLYEQQNFPEGLQDITEGNIHETIHPFSIEDLNPEVSKFREHKLPPRLLSKPETSEVPKSNDDIHVVSTKASMNESVLNATSSLSILKEGETLCNKLEEAIKDGDEKKANEIVSELARKKSKLKIREIVDEDEKRTSDASINVTVRVEEKQSKSPVSIQLAVDPNITTVGTLKKMVHEKYLFPIEVQRWVIGKRLPKDHETLRNLEVKTTGTVVFLYLLSAKDAGIERELIAIREDRFRNKAPSLPLRDYKRDENDGVPPLNATLHRYATVPSNPQRDSDFQFQPDLPPLLPREPAAVREDQYLNVNGQAPVIDFLPPPTLVDPFDGDRKQVHPRQIPSQQNEGWKCPTCTFINIPTRPGCAQCCTDRPVDYQLPPNFEIDEGERQRLEEEAFQDQLAHNYEENIKELERIKAHENYQQTLQVAQMALVPNSRPFECPVCFDEIQANEGVVLRECLHKFCRNCLKFHITNSNDPEIQCPGTPDGVDCKEVITAQEIQAILPEEDYMKYLQLCINAAETRAPNSFHCKSVDCLGWCYYEDEVNWFTCNVCGKRNCLTCKAIHDNMSCQEYQDDLKRRARSEDAARKTQEMLEELIRKGDAMKCPQCAVVLQKKDGCDWMRCSMCRTEICWATKGRRWGPNGNGDTSGGCKCSPMKRCHPKCGNCH